MTIFIYLQYLIGPLYVNQNKNCGYLKPVLINYPIIIESLKRNLCSSVERSITSFAYVNNTPDKETYFLIILSGLLKFSVKLRLKTN